MDATVKANINDLLLKGDLQSALDALVEHLLEQDKRYAADFVALKSRLATLEADHASGLLSYSDYQLERNKILNAFLITYENLDQPIPTFNNRDGNVIRRGKLCHNIPDELVLNERQKCKIRIADTEEILRQGIDLPADAKIEDIDISNVMKVSIFDPSEGENFRVVSGGDDDEHVITETGSTWTFYITSLKLGQHDLQLNVYCVVNINGKEKKSLLSFDKLIEVRSAAPAVATEEKWQDLNVQIGGTESDNEKAGLWSRLFQARKRTMAVALVFVSLGMFAMFNGGNTGNFIERILFKNDRPDTLSQVGLTDLDTVIQLEPRAIEDSPTLEISPTPPPKSADKESQEKTPAALPIPTAEKESGSKTTTISAEKVAEEELENGTDKPTDTPGLPEKDTPSVSKLELPGAEKGDAAVSDPQRETTTQERVGPEPIRFRIVAELVEGRSVNLGERINLRVNTKGVSARDVLVYIDGRRKETMLEGNSLVLFLPARMKKYTLKVVHDPSGSEINGKLTGMNHATITVIDRLRRQ